VPLKVESITLQDFRSYESFLLHPGDRVTIIAGPNAVGKTNIIEAAQLLTSACSFRNPVWSECLRWGSDQSLLRLNAQGEGRSIETRLTITSGGRREYEVNGTKKRRLSEVATILPSVVFTPDDLRMVKDSAERRRGAIDSVGDQLSATYSAVRSDYERVVRQRNAQLKQGDADRTVMEALTQSMIDQGTAFAKHRKRLFSRLADKAADHYRELAPGESLQAVYESSWVRRGWAEEDDAAFERALNACGPEERARGVSLVGPHRDEIRFLLEGRDARTFASQGQQRTIALAWKLAEVSVITAVADQPPLLLLDDVMSELDEPRRHALAALTHEATQTVFTTTNIGYFDESMVRAAQVVTLG
jgi:DNA replication and repair protein RecF